MIKNLFIGIGMVILILFAFGCDSHSTDHHEEHQNEGSAHNGHNGHNGHHGGGELTIAQTIWTDKTELFVEFPVFVKGEKAVFLAHYTHLSDFQPVREGKLEVQLSGETSINAVANKPARTGIFLPELTPQTPGVYDLVFRLTTPQCSDTQIIKGLHVYSSQEEAKKRHPVDEEEDSGISFLKEQQWQIDFATVEAKKGRLASTLKVLGQVKPYWNYRTTIRASFAGKLEPPINKNKVPVLGQEVRKGESLGNLVPMVGVDTKIQMQAARDQIRANRLQMTLSKLELENLQRSLSIEQREAKLKIDQAKLQLKQAKRQFERIKRLRLKNGATENELQVAELKVRLMEQTLQSALDQLNLYPKNILQVSSLIEQYDSKQLSVPEAFPILSPISGTIVEASASTYEFVADQSPLFTVVNLNKVLLEGYIYEHDVEKIKRSPGAFVSIPGDEHPKIYIKGKPQWMGMVVDKQKRTIPILYATDNSKRQFRINGNIELAIETKTSNSGVIIPQEALLEEAGIKMVFVQVEGELFEARSVKVKLTNGGQALIEEGVLSGEHIVTKGVYIIWLSTKSNKLTSTHGHPH